MNAAVIASTNSVFQIALVRGSERDCLSRGNAVQANIPVSAIISTAAWEAMRLNALCSSSAITA